MLPSKIQETTKELVIPGGMPESITHKLHSEAQSISVLGSSYLKDDPAQKFYEEWVYLPIIHSPTFSSEFLNIIKVHNITSVYSPHFLISKAIKKIISDHDLKIKLRLNSVTKRTSNIEEILSIFNNSHNQEITTIIDVGVQYGTSFLMSSYRKSKHYLIEPATQYHSAIEKIYTNNNIIHELIPIALSNKNETLKLYEYDLIEKGKTSHSFLQAKSANSPPPYKTSDVAVKRLDDLFIDLPLEELSYLVKIDVDGLEEKIIQGGGKVLQKSALVILEAPLAALHQRLGMMLKLGFELWDICDPAYYHAQLSQVDLVFINKKIKRANINFRPWDQGPLSLDEWQGR